jgi:hypothetical protein
LKKKFHDPAAYAARKSTNSIGCYTVWMSSIILPLRQLGKRRSNDELIRSPRSFGATDMVNVGGHLELKIYQPNDASLRRPILPVLYAPMLLHWHGRKMLWRGFEMTGTTHDTIFAQEWLCRLGVSPDLAESDDVELEPMQCTVPPLRDSGRLIPHSDLQRRGALAGQIELTKLGCSFQLHLRAAGADLQDSPLRILSNPQPTYWNGDRIMFRGHETSASTGDALRVQDWSIQLDVKATG